MMGVVDKENAVSPSPTQLQMNLTKPQSMTGASLVLGLRSVKFLESVEQGQSRTNVLHSQATPSHGFLSSQGNEMPAGLLLASQQVLPLPGQRQDRNGGRAANLA